MRSFRTILASLVPLLGVAVVGCTTGTATEEVGTGQARIVLASQGAKPATMHVTATDDATSRVVLDKSVSLTQGRSSVISASLAAAAYTIHVEATETGGGAALGSADAHADLVADQTKEIHLTAQGTSGAVSVNVNTAPVIHGIEVSLASGLGGQATITVDASDPDGGEVSFFWSGLGMDGAEQGSAALSLTAAAAAAFTGAPVVHLVVQDSGGATASADIDFAGSASCVVCGTSSTTTGTSTGGSASVAACFDAQAQCDTMCDATLSLDPGGLDGDLTCLASCGLVLASCMSN